MPGHDEKITLIVQGNTYETYRKTLRRYKQSYLGKLNEKSEEYCLVNDAYFINSDVKCFETILFFHQTGILSCPNDVFARDFANECEYFRLPCNVITDLKAKEGILDQKHETKGGKKVRTSIDIMQGKMWDILEKPESSYFAKSYSLFSLFMILLSIFVACMETVSCLNIPEKFWADVDLIINCWFMFELSTRLVFSPDKLKFLKNVSNWIDAIAVLPFVIMMVFRNGRVNSLGFLRCFRFVRALRLFQLSQQNRRIQIIGEVIVNCRGDFQMLFLCLMIVIILGASIIVFLEEGANPKFNSIPSSMWWSVVTLTTVGYGDISPVTPFGQLFSSLFMVVGTMVMFLPILAVANSFIKYYIANIPNSIHLRY